MKSSSRFCVLLLLLSAIPVTSQAFSQQKLLFRAPDEGPFTQYVTSILEEAYAKLDIKLEYIELPRVRGEQLATEGTIAGELGRTASLEEKRDDLRRIPFPLFSFDIIAVADRRNCGYCSVSEIESLAYVNGMDSITNVVEKLPYKPSIVTPINFEQVVKLLDSGRIQFAFMTDFQFKSSKLSNNPHLITHTLSSETGFHYLNEEHARLIPQLTYYLQTMRKNGRMEELRKQYGIETQKPIKLIEPPKQLTVVGALHPGLINADGTGKLWEIAQTVFPTFGSKINKVVSSWQRSFQLMGEGRADALIGVRPDQQIKNAILSKYHVGYDDSVFLFSLEESKEGPICVSGPHFMETLFETQRPFYRASNSLDCFALLDLGRVSAVIDYKDNLPDWTEKPYKKKKLSAPQPLFVAFSDSGRGRALRQLFDKAIVTNKSVVRQVNKRL
ncbi:ABC transporter substrate-binding protein [Idiomarina sp. HP20-50]|uniref:ABC transporter substrate-binding protein n=1 Tax=Idiomarina sp. HP20-50 TaxID=3070813 RepID=UPI00294AADAE|nr:ABC transporter substrate-binding protein [Idiomarina sp. HP20-50]MDV6316673.1 ABC transporter substrate-binding protein [Idiomarina sp. HP20-50]